MTFGKRLKPWAQARSRRDAAAFGQLGKGHVMRKPRSVTTASATGQPVSMSEPSSTSTKSLLLSGMDLSSSVHDAAPLSLP